MNDKKSMITVVIVEDQTLVREGLVRLLEFSNNVRVVGTACDGEAAKDVISKLSPDVALVDIQMPKVDGLTLTTELTGSNEMEMLKVIILTTFDDPHYLAKAEVCGAAGFLLKDASLEKLEDTIQRVYAGQKCFPTQNKVDASDQLYRGLTPREKEIFVKIAEGFSNKEIAVQLDLSNGTVKNHVSNILSKLEVRDRTQAVVQYRAYVGVKG